MNISIETNIKRLRKEKNLTQEALADLLGVSFQAVSKWENNIGYPDITLLPALSSILDVSLDSLMGVDRSLAEQERILLEIGEKAKTGRLREAYETGKEGLQRFPANNTMLYVTSSLALGLHATADKEEKAALQEAVQSMTDRILTYSSSDELRVLARSNLVSLYLNAKNNAAALEAAKELPRITSVRELTIPLCLEHEEKNQFMEKTMYLIVTLFTSFIHNGAYPTRAEIPPFYQYDRKTCTDFITIWDIAFSYLSRSEETKKININYLTLHFFAAKCAYEDNDITAALRHLKTAADCSIAIDKAENLPLEVLSSNNAIRQLLHTIPGFALTQEEVLAHSLSYSILHGFLETNLFAQLKEDADYLKIIRRLEQYARLPAFSVS